VLTSEKNCTFIIIIIIIIIISWKTFMKTVENWTIMQSGY